MEKKKLTPLQAKQTIRQYCAYQERSHSEVKERLYSFGLSSADVESLVADLVSEDFLNEERFARAFARGKFRMKGWGKVKIRHELKLRQVSDYCIRKGLSEIDEDEYENSLKKYFEEKMRLLKQEKNLFTKKRKLLNYLLQKGYEKDLVLNLLNHHS